MAAATTATCSGERRIGWKRRVRWERRIRWQRRAFDVVESFYAVFQPVDQTSEFTLEPVQRPVVMLVFATARIVVVVMVVFVTVVVFVARALARTVTLAVTSLFSLTAFYRQRALHGLGGFHQILDRASQVGHVSPYRQ